MLFLVLVLVSFEISFEKHFQELLNFLCRKMKRCGKYYQQLPPVFHIVVHTITVTNRGKSIPLSTLLHIHPLIPFQLIHHVHQVIPHHFYRRLADAVKPLAQAFR